MREKAKADYGDLTRKSYYSTTPGSENKAMAKLKQENQQSGGAIPSHVAVIMDGNGRWAKNRGLPRSAGHTAGATTFRRITRYASRIGIKYFTVYAFSTENWKRPADEVDALMKLFHKYLVDSLTDFRDDDIVVRFIGDKSGFSDSLQKLIDETEEVSKGRNGMILNIAMNYGGRDEILRAVKALCTECTEGNLSPDDITKELFEQKLYTANQPDPDLIIRPGGEARISNFLLYQSAYSEFYSTDVLWPDFSEDDLIRAIDYYSKKNRRFGGV